MKSSMISKDSTRRKWHHNILGEMFGSFSFINVFSGKEIMDAENGMQNMVEVAVAVRIVQLLHKECAVSKHNISIAVLSPYPAQVQCMQTQLENNKYQNNDFFKVKVGVVDEYQGEKVDVVIISTVGANGDEVNRNLDNSSVLFTWSRHYLWILGDERVHMKGGSMWKSLIRDAKARKCFFHADEHKDLAKVILEVKKDLRQLDELLSGETTLFRSTTWKVLFSRMFIKSFSKIESWETKKLVLLMLLKISSGWRPKRSYTATAVSESPYRDLMKEFKVKGMHLICTVDIVKETQYTQVLKVWDILPFHEIPELVKRLEKIIGTYTREYIERCKTKCSLRGCSEFPMKWPLTSEIAQCKTHDNFPCDDMFMGGASGNGCVENVKVRESLLLMKFYSLSATVVNNMISGCDGGELALPFELTEQEKDVVSFDKSSFILGRSGTGKTTVLTTKLFQNEQLHHLACEGFHETMEKNEDAKQDILRQLFVTFSGKLCYAVKQHVDGWKRLTCVGSSSTQNSSVRIDDIDKMMSEDSPDQFMHLSNDAYPLIITFNRFLLMLDGTVGTSFFERLPYVRQLVCGNQTSNSRLVVWEEYMKFNVTYEIFRSSYWPHFNNKLTKNLDPSAIYTEIMSVIKGGFTEDNTSDGIISRDDYVALCDRRISIFDSQKRELVYAIFLQYEKKKVQNGNFDLADLVNDLHQRLQVEGYKGDKMDYVFIDEVQDLSVHQIMLFKYVCPNVHEGFAFAGDTAQAIAKGIGFRFEDIRYMFFKKFLLASEKGQMFKMFQLSENFRTHAGVLNLAQSVIDVLYHFFPLFVDALSPETSRIGGELPVLLETENEKNAIKVIFEKESDNSHKITSFGAEQVVLVRDDIHKEKVVNIVGKNALVLTIMESKGLEFQDVLLYDVFTTSPFSNEWRIIYEYMKEKDILSLQCKAPCSSFEMEKHAVLCSELKQLYVAITRTRQRLWICETTGFSHPVYDFWKKLSLVEIKHLTDSFANEMQVPSSKNEWRSRGIKLFHENNFRMAQLCFLKAEDKYSERLAEAHHLRAIAINARASYPERRKLFEDAAKLFNSIGKKELAAECFSEIEDYKTAGDIYLSESLWMKAGNCYYLAKCYKLAVEVYTKAGAFAECLSACLEGKLFELGFELIGRWGDLGGAELEFFHKGALYYFSLKDFHSMVKFVRSFRSKDEIRNFLTKKRCFDELVSLEKEWGNFEEAAEVANKGARYYYSVKNFKSMMKCVRAFRNKNEMQNFLYDKRFFDELISLEKEWGNFEKAAKLIQEAAVYYFSVKNFKCMMKFVRSFSSKYEMRRFLHEKRCYDELISLEKEWGNFEEAAEVTNKGACYYYSVKNFESMMKYVRAFRNKNEMQNFLYDKRCFDELILLEEEWGNFEKAAKWIHEATLYYFSVKNFKCMMNFVRSFSSKDEMRRFLHEKRCLDELILLEKEWGNFEKAANVARLKPDPVLEADLLHQGGLHKESSLIILWHVFLNSPIFRKSDEPFKQKNELLSKAVLIAKSDSDVFDQFVSLEKEILSKGKTKEELLKNGIEFLHCYKENALAMGLERVKTKHEIEKIEEDVLHLIFSYFKSVDCIEEILLLLETRGKFVEAAKLDNEEDHSIEATLRRLWYIFFGSLWAHGKRALPLKNFKRKDELLNDVNSYVKDHPDSQDSELLLTEISVLSGAKISLPDMCRYLRETPRERNLRIHFLISRRILDVHLRSIKHLEGVISENFVYVEGLVYFWSYWKELISELINWSHARVHGCKIYEDFIFNYFGVRKYNGDKNGSYVVLDNKAQWVKKMNPIMVRKGYLYIIHAHEFSSVATRYWCSELLFVAEKVLKKLRFLHACSTDRENFSMHQETKVLTSLFEVVKSLQKCKLPYSQHHADLIIDKYLQPCVDRFLRNVFHINWKDAQSKEMRYLRGSETFLNILNEAINVNTNSQNDLTYGQLGRIAMIFLGSKMTGFNDDMEKKVTASSENWRDLFAKLHGDGLISRNEDLAIGLHNVLEEAFFAGFLEVDDFMSPACFLFLMERLMILSFCYRGYVLTTRSSCVEWLAYEAWDLGLNGHCVTCIDTMKNIHQSIASMVSKMLSSKENLMEWLRRSKEMESLYPILVMRLTVLLCLICANSGEHYDLLIDLLGHAHSDSLLPSAFLDAVIKGINEDCLVDGVAIACEEIDNPLIIASSTKDFALSAYEKAIFLDMTELDFRQKMLYPDKYDDASTSTHHWGAQELNDHMLHRVQRSFCMLITRVLGVSH